MRFLLICGVSRGELLKAEASGETVEFCITPGEELCWDNIQAGVKFSVDVFVRRVEITTEDFSGIATLHCEMTPEALQQHPELVEAGLTTFRMEWYEFARHVSQAPNRHLVPTAEPVNA